MNTIIEKIRAEIERRMRICERVRGEGGENQDYYHGKAVSYNETLTFLSDLEKQENHVPNDLEEVALEFADREYMVGDVDRSALYKGFWHGAKCQKEQMMKEAVEGWVAIDKRNNCNLYRLKPKRAKSRALYWTTEDCCFLPITARMFPGFKWEDEPKKVRIIIVKED